MAEDPDVWYTRAIEGVNEDCDREMAETKRTLQGKAFLAMCGAAGYVALRKDPTMSVWTRIYFGGMWTLLVVSTTVTMYTRMDIEYQRSIRLAEARRHYNKRKRLIEGAIQQNDTTSY
jgi:hypothetical protein